ncbi:hypothetical protein [Kitasatospora acidiphila]
MQAVVDGLVNTSIDQYWPAATPGFYCWTASWPVVQVLVAQPDGGRRSDG